MCFPTAVEGQVRNNGCYDPFPYRFWSYPKSARNPFENETSKMKHVTGELQNAQIANRILRPKMLCFIDERSPTNLRGTMDPEEWIKGPGHGKEPAYIFVSYTSKQFSRRCKSAQMELKETGLTNCRCKSSIWSLRCKV
jgi:hypothetical protein